jgi:phospholipid/cholesterol/gamma-HCH transport system ATP-binding protein
MTGAQARGAQEGRPPKLELRGVKKSFAGKMVLDGVDIAVERGRSLVIIGGSGEGKSVTLKIAIGLMRPDAGTVLVDGRDVTRLSGAGQRRLATEFGMLFQGAALFDSLSVWENVAFRLLNADRVGRPEARNRALAALGRVGLDPGVADLYPGELSGGMQKRVGLARAVAAEPAILFFDEPTTGLDPINADVINNLIVEQVRRLGCTAISITHDLVSARKIGDEIAMLHGGRIIWRGPTAAIDDSGDPYVDQFIHGRAAGPITGGASSAT